MLREEKADTKYKVVNRQRHHFVFKDLPYSVDVYDNIYGREKTYIIRFANIESVEPKLMVPEFIKVEKDVRSDPQFSLRNIAKA